MAKRISQKDAEEKARKKLETETSWFQWEVTSTYGRVNWVFKFRGGLGPSEREYRICVNRANGDFSYFKRLE